MQPKKKISFAKKTSIAALTLGLGAGAIHVGKTGMDMHRRNTVMDKVEIRAKALGIEREIMNRRIQLYEKRDIPIRGGGILSPNIVKQKLEVERDLLKRIQEIKKDRAKQKSDKAVPKKTPTPKRFEAPKKHRNSLRKPEIALSKARSTGKQLPRSGISRRKT